MAAAVIGSLRVVLGLDSAQFTEGMTAARKHLRDVGRQMQSVGNTMAMAGAGMTAAITAPLIAAGFAASKAASEAADAMGQVEAALKSMGNASGQTKASLAGLASDVMRNSLYDDDDILRKVTANLLTFGKVAGAEFGRAQTVIADVATRMKMDLQPATLLIGKALNDPIKGMTAMGRAGIQFSAAQKATIKTMVETGNVAGAQGIILTELERQFGGAAAAAQNTDPYDGVRDSLNDLSESMGAIINTHLKPFIEGLKGLADTFNGLSPQMQQFAFVGAIIAASLGPALIVIGSLVSAVGGLVAAFAAGGLLAGVGAFVVAAAPFIAAAAAIAAAIYIFRDDLAPIFQEFKAAAMEALGPALAQVMAAAKEAIAAIGPAFSAIMGVIGPILAALAKLLLQAFGPILLTMLRVMAAGITNAFAIIGQALKFVAGLLTGDWKGAWNAAGTLLGTIVQGIGRVIDAVFPGALAAITRMVDGVKRLFRVDLAKAFDDAKAKVRDVGDAFYNLWDRVVGHSYIPDMVEGVAAWMAKLDAGMVAPAKNATAKTAEAFKDLRTDVAAIMEGLLSDSERAARDLAAKTETIRNAVKAGMMTGLQGQTAIAGVAGQDLVRAPIDAISPIETELPKVIVGPKVNQAFEEAARNFGDEFAYNVGRVLDGDIKGAFNDMLSTVLRGALSSFGTGLFKGGGSGGGFDFGGIAKSIGSFFTKLPGFKNGGSIMPGGAGGGIDSQLVQFWKSPSEQVDVYHPSNDRGGGGGEFALHVVPSPYFDARVERVSSGPAARAGSAAYGAARTSIPAEMAGRQRYSY